MLNRAAIVDRNFIGFCEQAAREAPSRESLDGDRRVSDASDLTVRDLRELFESQVVSRQLDLAARELRRTLRGFYTIGSSGHEGNAVLGRALRHTDPAFLHYRSGALMAERARRVPGVDFIRDTLLSFMAAVDDPISGGRHKVWGSVPLAVPPQTSTIASHLPRAFGAAMAIERCKRLGRRPILGDHGEIPPDSIILCNFGDASANHSAATGAFNATSYAAYQNLPVPLLFVCEDNGIGISVHTAGGWIEAALSNRPGLRYFSADGLSLLDAWRAADEASRYVRATRRPAFLHLKVVRLLGHAGTDVEAEYHTPAEIAQAEARDPLLASARTLIDLGVLSATDILNLYEGVRQRIHSESERLGSPRKLTSAAEIIAPLAPYSAERVAAEATRAPDPAAREHAFALPGIPGFPGAASADTQAGAGRRLPELQPPRHMACLINWALHDLMAKYPEMTVFGEDVARKGGVYHVTANLSKRFGLARVYNTLLDETTILGSAIGAGHLGLLPFPEIQYLAYVHNAIDQLRGEACSSQFFSNGQFPNPMVVRIASLGYQKGFGGHFHNDNSIAALRDIPGLILACPSRGDDAAGMLRTCAALARIDGRVVAFLEPIALYMTKDLHAEGDGGWLCPYPPPDQAVPFGEGRIYGPESADLVIFTFGNGVPMALQAARRLAAERDAAARVVDLRWLNPLNHELILSQAVAAGRALVVDEGRYSGGVAEAILALLAESRETRGLPAARVTGLDSYTPLGPAANLILPSVEQIVDDGVRLLADVPMSIER